MTEAQEKRAARMREQNNRTKRPRLTPEEKLRRERRRRMKARPHRGPQKSNWMDRRLEYLLGKLMNTE